MSTVTPRLIRSGDCRVMPWKNGQGSTTELAVAPPDALLDGFDWRISIAELRGSGSFSSFPGYERLIVQLDGPPMILTHGAGSPVALEPLVPHGFSGDDETACDVAGIAHDFNLIVRRAVVQPTLTVCRLEGGNETACESGAVTVLHVLAGRLQAADGVDLHAGDTRVADSGEMPAHWAKRCAVVIVARLA